MRRDSAEVLGLNKFNGWSHVCILTAEEYS